MKNLIIIIDEIQDFAYIHINHNQRTIFIVDEGHELLNFYASESESGRHSLHFELDLHS